MALENKWNITNSTELAWMEEKISKTKAGQLFESDRISQLKPGTLESLFYIHKYLFDEIYDREVYRKGIDYSYSYEGYTAYRTEEL